MEERYIRNLGALTESEQLALRGKHVLVAGCGGLGGYIIEMLLRVGVGTITAADGDVFQPSDLNRQLLCDGAAIGRNKARAAAERAALVAPETRFVAFEGFVSEENADELMAGCDAVMDALDTAEARLMLARASARTGVPVIHGAIEGWNAQAALSTPGDGLLERLYPEGEKRADHSVLSFTPALCAAVQCALCVRLLCGREVRPGRLYCADLLRMDFTTLMI